MARASADPTKLMSRPLKARPSATGCPRSAAAVTWMTKRPRQRVAAMAPVIAISRSQRRRLQVEGGGVADLLPEPGGGVLRREAEVAGDVG